MAFAPGFSLYNLILWYFPIPDHGNAWSNHETKSTKTSGLQSVDSLITFEWLIPAIASVASTSLCGVILSGKSSIKKKFWNF